MDDGLEHENVPEGETTQPDNTAADNITADSSENQVPAPAETASEPETPQQTQPDSSAPKPTPPASQPTPPSQPQQTAPRSTSPVPVKKPLHFRRLIVITLLLTVLVLGLMVCFKPFGVFNNIAFKLTTTKSSASLIIGQYYASINFSYQGNTSGNIINGGFVATQGNWIYYSAVPSSGTKAAVYKIKTDGTGKTKLTDGRAIYINVADDWLYFATPKNDYSYSYYLYKMRTDGTQKTQMTDRPASNVNVVDGWIYFNDYRAIYRMPIDGTVASTVSDIGQGSVSNLVVKGSWIYYILFSTLGGNLSSSVYKMRTDGTGNVKVVDDKVALFDVAGDWIYYSVATSNTEGLLYKIRTDGTGKTKLDSGYPFGINVVDDWVYYAIRSTATNSTYTGMNGNLYKIRTDGTKKTSLDNQVYLYVSIAGDWIYCFKYDKDGSIVHYKIRTDGTKYEALED